MSKVAKDEQIVQVERPKRVKLSEEEILKRMKSFDERKDEIIAAVRDSKS